jgi:uncharacterized protein (TIGR02453 family)
MTAFMKDASDQIRFSGFSPEAFKFLKALKRNNKREWFQPRKTQFEELLQQPLTRLVVEIGEALGPQASGIDFDPRKAVFRIYRDVRFSNDKSPYKTHVAAFCRSLGPPSREESPGLYMHLDSEMVFVAAGLYGPSTRQLKQIRREIDANPKPLTSTLQGRKFKANFGEVQGEQYKRIPDGFPDTHPQASLLRLKRWVVSKTYTQEDAGDRALLKKLVNDFQIALPFVGWLAATTLPAD